MPTYQYIAINQVGERIAGETQASSPDEVVSQLAAQGLKTDMVLLGSDSAEKASAVARPAQLSAASTREVAGCISEIVAAGLPLEGGLAAIAAEYPNGKISRELRRIVAQLEAGRDLESILARRGSRDYLATLIRAGNRSGRTAEILDNFIAGSTRASDLRHSLWAELAYPLVVALCFVPVSVILLVFIVPTFQSIFLGFEVKLPVVTEVLLGLSGFVRTQWIWLAIAAIVLSTVVFAFILWGWWNVEIRRLMCRIPIWGGILRSAAMSRFSPLLATLIEARIPLHEALVLAGEACGDVEIAFDCQFLAEQLQAGHSLSSLAGQSGRLPHSFLRALVWEKYQDGFPEILRSMSDLYATRVRLTAALVTFLVPLFVILFFGAFTIFVIMALFFPLIELLNKLS